MKKGRFLVVLLLFAVLLTACGKKEEVKNNTPEEVKKIMEAEKEFTSGDYVHQEFINVKDFNVKELDIKWAETLKTVNIRGNMVRGYEVNANIELYDDYDSYVLGEDGTLYRYHSGNYSVMKPEYKINKLGIYYPDHGGSNACEGYREYVMDTEKGIMFFDEDYETGAVAIKKFSDDKYFRMPVCYGVAESKLDDEVVVYGDGRVLVEDKPIKDKANKEQIDAKYVIYAEKENKEKYYVISTNDKLYIIDEVAEYYLAVSTVDVKVNPSVSEELNGDVDITITAEDVTMELKYVMNQS